MRRLNVECQKTLKLSHVLIKEVNVGSDENEAVILEQMENYIKSKSAVPVGPLIQYAGAHAAADGSMELTVRYLRQLSKQINCNDSDYRFQDEIAVNHCLYIRFVGREEHLRLAYDKLNLYAYEEELKTRGDAYSVFVSQTDDIMVTDVFMECEENE